jgi:hypothetical protein
MTPQPSDDGRNPLIAAFHSQRHGITEGILDLAVADDDGRDPNDWVSLTTAPFTSSGRPPADQADAPAS